MLTTPSADDVLEGVIYTLQTDILPNVVTEKAQVEVVMIQAMLQMVRQVIPVFQQNVARECNEMHALYRDMGAIIGESAGEEADRMRARARDFGQRTDFPVIPSYEALVAEHNELSQGLVDCVRDLDAMARAGNEVAEKALQRMRAHLGPRILSDFGTMVVGAGMAGRG